LTPHELGQVLARGLEGDSGVGDWGGGALEEGPVGVSNNGGWPIIEEGLTAGPSQMPWGRGDR
jgi:hypothetical protein